MTHIQNGITKYFYVVFPILKYADLFDQYFSTSLFWGYVFYFHEQLESSINRKSALNTNLWSVTNAVCTEKAKQRIRMNIKICIAKCQCKTCDREKLFPQMQSAKHYQYTIFGYKIVGLLIQFYQSDNFFLDNSNAILFSLYHHLTSFFLKFDNPMLLVCASPYLKFSFPLLHYQKWVLIFGT